MRVDLGLARFVAGLQQRTSVSCVITSDHGAAPLPERSRAAGHASDRIFPDQLVREAESAADRALGTGTWVEAFSEPFLYLNASTRGRRGQVVPAIVLALEALPSALQKAVALSVPDDAKERLYVVVERWFFVDPDVARGSGTSHGSPWEYDREVPLIAWGPGVTRSASAEPVAHGRVAESIARLLGVSGGPGSLAERRW